MKIVSPTMYAQPFGEKKFATPCEPFVLMSCAIVGGNAFRHASGIHQDGVLKCRETYEAVDPAEIGHPVGTQIVLGKLSGRAGFASRVRALGIAPSDAALERAFARFQELADGRGEIADEELVALCREPEAGARSARA